MNAALIAALTALIDATEEHLTMLPREMKCDPTAAALNERLWSAKNALAEATAQ
jgi:hypothetical protein